MLRGGEEWGGERGENKLLKEWLVTEVEADR